MDLLGGHVFLEVWERRSARNRYHYRRFLQQPCKRELHSTDVATFRFGIQRIVRLSQRTSASTDRSPWNESQICFLAIGQRAFRFSVGNVVLVLHADNRKNFACSLN